MFTIDRQQLQNSRVEYIDDLIPIDLYLSQIEKAINNCYEMVGFEAVQHGRVIALRSTDIGRLSSAFKAGLYLGKYNDMENTDRFLTKMVAAGHSYEPIRGESVLFLFIGVGKPVYDHMTTYTVGRPTRIAGGQRANLPWGFEIPAELKGDTSIFQKAGIDAVRHVIMTTKGMDEEMGKQQIQAARSILPVGYIMPPFLLEFSEEALVKSVLTQRLWESGAQGATVDIVNDMWMCLLQLDKEKWETLLDYHGIHIQRWKKAMRTMRDKKISMWQFLEDLNKYLGIEEKEDDSEQVIDEYATKRGEADIYDFILKTYGKMPMSMWEKQQ